MGTPVLIESRGLRREASLGARVRERVDKAVGRLRVRPVAAQIVFRDDNGPRAGVQCTVALRLPYRLPLRAEHAAMTPRLAFDGALEALGRQVAGYRDRQRQRRRRPKKYFVTKRLLA